MLMASRYRLGYPGSSAYIADFNDSFARDKRQVLRVIRVAKDVLREWMEKGDGG
jgi:hypothetical protein